MRLIDADALIKIMSERKRPENGEDSTKARFRYIQWLTDYWAIADAPTVDAVKVVKCKDCRHRDPENKKCDCGHDIMWQLPREDVWFCADGEVKE